MGESEAKQALPSFPGEGKSGTPGVGSATRRWCYGAVGCAEDPSPQPLTPQHRCSALGRPGVEDPSPYPLPQERD